MNPVDANTARAAAGRLLDDKHTSMPTEHAMTTAGRVYLRHMADTNFMLREADSKPSHLAGLRAMFAAELTGQAREAVLLRIAKRHGELIAEMNLQACLHHLPMLAVYAEKRRPNG